MPTFLATDYLQEAVGQRRAVLGRMLLSEPEHLEATDSSINKNQDIDKTVIKDWTEEVREAGQVVKTESEASEIAAEFKSLTLTSQPVTQEPFDDSGLGSSPWTDWQDEEGFMNNHLLDSVQAVLDEACEEVFCVADRMNSSLEGEDLGLWFSEHWPDVTAEFDSMCLEDVILPDDLETYGKRLPGPGSLCKRLKPKVVQDPFLTRDGKLITEKLLQRLDFDYKNDHDEQLDLCCDELVEEIQLDEIAFFDDESYEELLVPENLDAVEETGDYSSLQCVTHSLDLQNEDMDEDGSPDALLSADLLNLCTSEVCDQRVGNLEVLSPLVEMQQQLDFLKGNSKGCEEARDCVQSALLESPILSPHPADSYPQLPFSLSSLSPIPVSPNWSLCLVSPNSVVNMESKLIEKSTSFDDVLGLMLVVPKLMFECLDPPNHSEIIEVLGLSEYQYSSELELILPWDPLADSVNAMIRGREILVNDWYHPNSCTVDVALGEEFVKDEPFYAYEGDDLPIPLSFIQRYHATNPASQAPGVPTWTSNAVPAGYHRTIPSISSCSNSYTVKQTKSKQQPYSKRMESERVDTLDNFLILRGTQLPSLAEVEESCANLDECAGPQCSQSYHTNTVAEIKPVGMGPWKTREVKLPGVFKEVVAMVEQRGEMLVSNLRQLDVLSPSQTFSTVTLEHLRFVLKEQEKSFENQTDPNADSLESYKLTACLYTLIDVADLFINCSFRSATDRFAWIQQQQRDVVGSCLEGLAQSLLANQCAFEEQKIVHPKMAALVDIATKIVKNRDKESVKALFVVSRSSATLVDELAECLDKVEGLRVKLVYPDADINKTSNDLLTGEKDIDCVVMSLSSPLDEFPWNEFQLIVCYEKDGSAVFDRVIQQASTSLKCRLVVLKVVGYSLQQGITELDKGASGRNRQQMVFIASRKVVEDRDLLQLLEARYNIIIVERNFSELEDAAARQYFPDAIVDERICIILLPESDLIVTSDVKALRHRITALSFKYETCWIILRTHSDTEKQTFGGSCSRTIARLLASVAHFSLEANGFEVRLVYAFDNDETARAMRDIGEHAYENTTVWRKTEWLQRSWLTEQMSLHEKCLLSVPCINSFSAQVMLTAAPLRDLLSMSKRELFSSCRWLPTKVLEHFYKVTRLGRRNVPASSVSRTDSFDTVGLSPRPHAVPTCAPADGELESDWNAEERYRSPIDTYGLDIETLPVEHEQQSLLDSLPGSSWTAHSRLKPGNTLIESDMVTAAKHASLESIGTDCSARCNFLSLRDDDETLQYEELNPHRYQHTRRSMFPLSGRSRDRDDSYDSDRSSLIDSLSRTPSLPKRRCLSGSEPVKKLTEPSYHTDELRQCNVTASQYFGCDRQVPGTELLDDASPNAADWSVFSPSLVSPIAYSGGKKLTYRREPGSANGQTKLAFS